MILRTSNVYQVVVSVCAPKCPNMVACYVCVGYLETTTRLLSLDPTEEDNDTARRILCGIPSADRVAGGWTHGVR